MGDPLQAIPEEAKPLIDGVSLATGAAAWFDYLPEVAAFLTVIWTIIRIYETKTVQRWLGKKDR